MIINFSYLMSWDVTVDLTGDCIDIFNGHVLGSLPPSIIL